jgi:hypothetical protein
MFCPAVPVARMHAGAAVAGTEPSIAVGLHCRQRVQQACTWSRVLPALGNKRGWPWGAMLIAEWRACLQLPVGSEE